MSNHSKADNRQASQKVLLVICPFLLKSVCLLSASQHVVGSYYEGS